MTIKNSNQTSKTKYYLNFWQWLKSEKVKLSFIGFILASLSVAPTFIEFVTGIKIFSFLPEIISKAIDEHPLQLFLFGIHIIFICLVLLSLLFDEYVKFDAIEGLSDKKCLDEHVVWKNLEIFENEDINKPKLLANNADVEPIVTDEKIELVSGEKIEQWKEFKRQTNIVIKQFFVAWFFCWFGWVILYLVLLSLTLVSELISAPESSFSNLKEIMGYRSVLTNTLNNFSSLMILVMYLTLHKKTAEGIYFILVILVGVVIIAVVALGNIVLLALGISDLSLSLLSGFFASISMALFFGSLNSFFIRIPSGLIICLHIYAAIQILFILESDSMMRFLEITKFSEDIQATVKNRLDGLMTFFYFLALGLKILLFLIIRWILKTARFVFSIVHKKSANNANENDELLKQFVDIMSLKEANISK